MSTSGEKDRLQEFNEFRSIVIPHLRRAVDFLDQVEGEGIHARAAAHSHD